MVDFSLVVPVYNEEKIIIDFYQAVYKVMTGLKVNYEIIFATGGNTDNTFEILKKIAKGDSRVKIINLSHRFNHQVALTAGLDYSSGNAVISLDGDLQHPPELIHKMIEEYKKGYDIVYTVRQDSRGVNIFKKIGTRSFYFLLGVLTKINFDKNCADFRLLSRKAVDALKRFPERKRYIAGIVSLLGFKRSGITYKSCPRNKGKTKFSFIRMCSMAIDGILSFSNIPIRIIIFIGFIMSLLSFVSLVYIIIWRCLHPQLISGWASILVSILFLSSIQILTLGILGEYIGRIYEESKQRPLYIIDELVGF
ncbi:MAG: glycosyltransferase family 2 protein [Candidatus Omnitrophica bacterium]|nr:glycosyltransferase family 2 protein [Candidatus Omnitrophota bacterium]